MKTILLAAVVSSSISPTASAINVQNELNNYSNSLNESNFHWMTVIILLKAIHKHFKKL